MSIPTALFVGDVSWDLTLAVDDVPAPDEKVHADGPRRRLAAVAAALAGASVRAVTRCGDDPVGREDSMVRLQRSSSGDAQLSAALACRDATIPAGSS